MIYSLFYSQCLTHSKEMINSEWTNEWTNIKTDSSIVVQLTSTSCENNDFIETRTLSQASKPSFRIPHLFPYRPPYRQKEPVFTHQPNFNASILTSIFLKSPHVLFACSHFFCEIYNSYVIVNSSYMCICYFLGFYIAVISTPLFKLLKVVLIQLEIRFSKCKDSFFFFLFHGALVSSTELCKPRICWWAFWG